MAKFLSFITISVSVYLLQVSEAHVALTFPTARTIDLDFLDFFRTKPPCGMPKGKYRTVLKAGSTINVTWHLSYPHQGGYQIELLDKNENLLTKLSKSFSNDSYIRGDPTAQWVSVMLPDTPCEDCTIRLLREVREWKDYGYWSCGDVSIVKPTEYKENCMGRGKLDFGSMCKCDKGYWGPRCQYKDECESDMDCGKGKCIEIEGTTLPRKQCFCSAGFHGDRCQMENKDMLPTPENLELSSHTKTQLSDRVTMYHKVMESILNDAESEVEFVLVVNGTSYIAVGWRPSSMNNSCKTMPYIDDNIFTRKKRSTRGRPFKSNPTLLEPLHMPERIVAEIDASMNSKRSTKGSPTSKNSLKPETPTPGVVEEPSPIEEPEPESVAEPGTDTKSGQKLVNDKSAFKKKNRDNAKQDSDSAASEPEPEAASEPISEPEAASEPISEPGVSASSEAIAESVPSAEAQSEPEASSEPEPSSEPVAEPETPSKPISEPKASSEPVAEPESSVAAVSEPEASSEPESEPEVSSEPESAAAEEPKSEPEVSTGSKPEPEPSSEPISEPESTNNPKPTKSTRSVGPEPKPTKLLESLALANSELEEAADESVGHNAFVVVAPISPPTMAWDEPSPFKLEYRNTSYSPKLNHFHPMDCSDVIVSTARGMYSRVRDSYTRDASSPRPDTVYGGTYDLTAATGWEINGVTTIIFRRKVKTADPTDHELSGSLHFVWARGQEHDEYVHDPKSGLETEYPSIPKFYGQDELKYHGQMSQRGVITLTM